MNLYRLLSLSFTIPLVGTLILLNPQKAQAGCGLLDPTCRSGPDDCLFGSCDRGGGSGAEIQVITPATYYDFQVRNTTNDIVNFSINGTRYTLQPGYRQDFRYQRTAGSSSGGGSGQHYTVTIRWDGAYASGYQDSSFVLPFSGFDSWYEFQSANAGIYLY
jgi:hypothetical protein